ncbi:GNAT family N-acetyltransferase [Knoellia aerolata]|uniref:N-acetyltransferase domain-containing protein n=1 Tax=Knoellia aerolata DSM 18566 TaxID=1385519 RepID=A0A0A0K4D0_9MICO|nr:GNAT family N-acetyltransferase [Knoellia aerolata]KGN43137.1 hypothetical protein N801_05280 [Knoellia aerolata DSM 18566]
MNLPLMAATRARREARARAADPLHLRCLTPDDGHHVRDLLERMSPQSRYQRYFRPVRSFRPADVARFVAVGPTHVAVGAFDRGCLVGTAQYFRSSQQPGHAEVAVEVADSHHGRGVASRLVHELAGLATDVGITHFTATVLTDNRPVLSLMRSLGWQVAATPDGAYTEIVATLPPDLVRNAVSRGRVGWAGWQTRRAGAA